MSEGPFFILFLVLTAIMALFPFLMKRIGVPSVISLLLVGMLIGDTGIGLNLIPRIASAVSFLGTPGAESITAAKSIDFFTRFVNSLGSLGLVFLMALAGMEADFNLLRICRKPVLWLSVLTFCLPAAGGFLLYRHYYPGQGQLAGQLLYASLFASHSVGIVFPVIRDLRLSHTRFGATVLIGTVITDIASILLLAVSVQIFRQTAGEAHMVLKNTLSILDHNAGLLGNSFMPVFLAIVLAFLFVSVFAVNKVGGWFMRHISAHEDIMVTIMLVVILVVSLIGELLGINFIVGAFIAGLGLSRVVQAQDKLLFKKFENIGYAFLIPYLFVSIGLDTDFRAFTQPGSLPIVILTVVVLVGTKFISGLLAMKLSGFNIRNGIAAGLMTIPQLSATLTAAAIGKDLGILSSQFFNAIIILSIITTLPIPSLVRFVVLRNRTYFRDPTTISVDYHEPTVVQNEELL